MLGSDVIFHHLDTFWWQLQVGWGVELGRALADLETHAYVHQLGMDPARLIFTCSLQCESSNATLYYRGLRLV